MIQLIIIDQAYSFKKNHALPGGLRQTPQSPWKVSVNDSHPSEVENSMVCPVVSYITAAITIVVMSIDSCTTESQEYPSELSIDGRKNIILTSE